MVAFLGGGTGLGVLLVSAGMLAFEIGLSRAFAVQQFYHFAFVVISLAVMGLAASGALLAMPRRRPSLTALSSGYAVSVLAAYAVINWLPFDSYSIAWDGRQIAILLLYFLAAGAPFVWAGWVVGAAVLDAGSAPHRPYAANLIGSALGCIVALSALAMAGAEGAVLLSSATGFLAAAVLSASRPHRMVLAGLAIGLAALAIRPPAALRLSLSPYKPLSQALLLPDARWTLSRVSPTARVDVVETASLHVFPGLSLNAAVDLPGQAALFIDGDGPYPVTALAPDDPDAAELAGLLPTGLAYQLRPGATALILQSGAGLEAQLALAAGAAWVQLPVDEPLVFESLRGPEAPASLGLLNDPRVVVLDHSGRGALANQGASYDLVVFALSEPFRPVAAGAFSLTEYYALTWQALYAAYDRLSPDGILVVTRWLGNPPSESARAWATLLSALKEHGVDDPGPNLVAYRSMRTATLLAARRPFSPPELGATREFLERNGFDPIWLPDLEAFELNRHNRLPSDVYHELFADLLRRPQQTLANFEFNLTPPSDSRPYFYHYFRWRQTPQVVAALGTQWLPFGGSGYLVLLALLALTVLLAGALALIPAVARPHLARLPRLPRRWLLYFAALGAGYLWVEIPLVQRLTLLLDRPALALALVLFTLLMASGIGSLLSERLPLRPALAGLVGVVVVEVALLPELVRLSLPWGFFGRAAVSAAVVALPGLLMGIPFAAGLRRLRAENPQALPWAWAVNGAVSGVSGVVAAIITLDWGFGATSALGAAAYAAAWVAVGGEAVAGSETAAPPADGPRGGNQAASAPADGPRGGIQAASPPADGPESGTGATALG